MSSDTSNSGIMQKADQIAFHFYTKLFYIVNQARATEEPHSQGKIDKWFNLETPDSDLFTREAREPYRNISLSSRGPPPLEIQVLLCIPDLTSNQVLIHRSDDSSNTTDPSTQQPPSPTTSSGGRSQLRIEPTPHSIVLETFTLTFVPHGNSTRLGDQALPTIYKHGIPLFRCLYSLLRVLPVWKLYKRLKRRTGGVNRNGQLGIKLRVGPLDERGEDGVLDVLAFDIPPSPSHPPLRTETHTFSPLPHPLGSLALSATYLCSPNFELDELESHLSSRFISSDFQGFVPTLSKHAVREEKEDGVGGARSPPRAIIGATGKGRGGHGLGPGLGTGLGLPSAGGLGESTSSISSVGRPPTTRTNNTDNTTVAERFIIPSRVPSLNLGVTSSSSSSALIPPPRPQFTPLPLPLPFPTVGAITSSSSVPSSGSSGLGLHRIRRESSNSLAAVSASPGTGIGGGSPSSEIFLSSISHRTSQSHSPYPHPHPQQSSVSSSPISGAGMGAVPIRSGMSINPFKGNILSAASGSGSASGSSPSLSIRQGLSSGLAGGGGSPLSTGFAGSSQRIQTSSPVGSGVGVSGHGAAPSSLSDRRGKGRMSSESDKGEWDRDGEGSRERDRLRRVSAGYSMPSGSGSGAIERQEDATGGLPTRIPSTRKRYSSSFGNRYVGSGGSGVGSGIGGESGGSTPASVSTSTGVTTGGEGASEGVKEKEQNAAAGIASFLSTATDDDDISIFVQDIDSRKPLSGREREREKRERDREREMERGRERDREEEGQDHDRETMQESKGKRKVGQGQVKLVTSPVSWQRRRSPLSPRSPLTVYDREGGQHQVESILTPSPPTTLGTAFPAQATNKPPTLESTALAVPTSGSTTATAPETTTQRPSPSTSPPVPVQLSTSPNRGPMLTNQDEVDERLKRMNETFMKSLEGMERGGSGGRRRDKDKGKETETERDATRCGLSLLVSASEGEVSATNRRDDGPFTYPRITGTSPRPGLLTDERYPNPIPIPSPSSIPAPNSSSSSGSGSSSNQRSTLHPQTGFGLGLGLGRGFISSTSTSTSASASSEAIGASQGSEEVIGRMDFYDEGLCMGRRRF